MAPAAWQKRSSWWGFLFVLPWLIGFIVFALGPMLGSLSLSFAKYDLHESRFVGGENYRRLFTQDPLFWQSLKVTTLYAVASVPLGLAASLCLALLLNQKVRGQRLFRSLFYLPSLTPAVASALLWMWVLNADNGILNYCLSMLGISGPAWLQDSHYALWSFVLMSLWGAGGARMIIFLAGLQGIEDGFYEAARIDGAGTWQQFRKITLPLLSPTIFFNLIIGTIAAFQNFTSAYVMTNGGPENATLFYVLYLFRNAFEFFKLGKASAMAWVLFVLLLAITALQFRQARRWVHYEGADA